MPLGNEDRSEYKRYEEEWKIVFENIKKGDSYESGIYPKIDKKRLEAWNIVRGQVGKIDLDNEAHTNSLNLALHAIDDSRPWTNLNIEEQVITYTMKLAQTVAENKREALLKKGLNIIGPISAAGSVSTFMFPPLSVILGITSATATFLANTMGDRRIGISTVKNFDRSLIIENESYVKIREIGFGILSPEALDYMDLERV